VTWMRFGIAVTAWAMIASCRFLGLVERMVDVCFQHLTSLVALGGLLRVPGHLADRGWGMVSVRDAVSLQWGAFGVSSVLRQQFWAILR
jgi:hypothetical protein